MGEELVRCIDVNKVFSTRRANITVLSGINIEVKKGEICIIKGKSGVGKSTLIGLLAGLDRPTSGEILFEGRSFEAMSEQESARFRRERIGIIFQDHNLLPAWTALENVMAALVHSGLPKKERRQKATDLLVQFGLEKRLDHIPSELSEGQKQRVAIARSLVNEPSLVLADQPTSDVDTETASGILNLLVDLTVDREIALVMTTHNDDHLSRATSVYLFEQGKLTRTLPYHEEVI